MEFWSVQELHVHAEVEGECVGEEMFSSLGDATIGLANGFGIGFGCCFERNHIIGANLLNQ